MNATLTRTSSIRRNMATLYAKLGVPQDATWDEIKRAYRKAAMKWHPDRNTGREDVARATFQEIKDAYAILSDDTQRKIYDAVYAEEMQRWELVQKREQEKEAQRVRAAQAAAQARYVEMVGVAMRYAEQGHNRDVLFGVLLGRDCDADLAGRIADSTWALLESRRAAKAAQAAHETAPETVTPEPQEGPPQPASTKHEKATHEQRGAGVFDSLWQGFFGIRS